MREGPPARFNVRVSLPPYLTSRPLTRTDAPDVHGLMAAQELAVLGRVEIEEADIVADWQRPSFDVGASTIGVVEDGRLVGYAEITDTERGDAAVHPDRQGRGIGAFLAEWMQREARRRGYAVVGMPVPQGGPGDRLLTALGYHVRWTSWVLRLPPGAQVPRRPLPQGWAVGPASPERLAEAHRVVEDAFGEWTTREPESLADFEAQTVRRPGFAPWMLRVATGPDGDVGAVAVVQLAPDGEAFVSRLATRADLRHRGLAQALLVDAFAAGREHGATAYGLSTDSRTGALDLYRKVGMEVTDVWLHRAIRLDDGAPDGAEAPQRSTA